MNKQSRFNFINQLNVDQYTESRLSDSLRRVVEGSNEVYVTPLARGIGTDKLLSEFKDKFSDKIAQLQPDLRSLEESNLTKFGPRSIAKPWKDRKESVLQYFEPGNANIKYSDLSSSIRDKSNLRPLSLAKASEFLKNNTSSGLPFMRPKGLVKAKVLDNFDKLLSRKDPCVLFTRTQEGNKTRNVWGYPIADTLNEMRIYRPLLEYQRNTSWRSALIGPEQVNTSMTNLINSGKVNGYKLISIDFSSFDSSVKQGLQKVSFDYIKSLFQYKYGMDIDYIFQRFSTIGIITPDGIVSGPHGVPSGSTFTNEVDSISQYLIAVHSGVLRDGLFEIQGDDGAYAVPESDVDILISAFKHYGLNVNMEKSYISNNFIIYLQNLYHDELRNNGRVCGIYPICRALNRLAYQENWDDFEEFSISGKDYYSLRAISILENCKYHPLFEDFVKFVLKLDKYNLQVSQVGLQRYVEMMTSKLGTEGLFTNQYGDNIRGIRGFETFKVINRLMK